MKTRDQAIRKAVADAIHSIGLEAIKKGPFFGIGESRKGDTLKAAA